MYNSQETALRIKNIAKSKNISIAELQTKCGLGKNAINQLSDSQEGMKSKNLYAIADYLNVSADYLLGRTENQEINSNNINQQYIGGNATANIGTTDSERSDTDSHELIDMIKQLSIVQRAEIILKINEMLNKN